MPPRGIAEISSSMVKGLIGPVGWESIVREYVPKPVFEKVIKGISCPTQIKIGGLTFGRG